MLKRKEKMRKNCWFKVSLNEYAKARDNMENEVVKELNNLELPQRATRNSAGYDFHTPIDLEFPRDNGKVISLGVRVRLEEDVVLLIMPRSSLGFKYGMRLANTVGVIDSDYYYAENEGHIKVKLFCDKPCSLKANERICQGIIIPYRITSDDEPISEIRTGGFGSTNK